MKAQKSIVFILALLLIFNFQFSIFKSAHALTESEIQEQEAKWRLELQKTEEEIAAWQKELDRTKQGTRSLQNEATILQTKINEAKAYIKKRQLEIDKLTRDIGEKNKSIAELDKKIERGKQSLSSIIRATDEIDSYSLAEIVLSNQNLSSFFEDISAYDSIKQSLADKFAEIRDFQEKMESEKKVLNERRTEETDTKAKIEEDKKRIERDEAEKQRLIKINKSQEKSFEQVITEKQKKAAEIRAALFSLRDSQSIPFGEALNFASKASVKTGVRPALILAILTQESDLGKNQGSCLINNLETGDGSGKNTGRIFEKIMKSPRDTDPFKNITGRLAKDWKMTPVSCPLDPYGDGKYYVGRGYGGGMGPSQFIPSTWELFKEKLGRMLDVDGEEVNPWNAEHAIMATAVYLADLGAANGGYTAERNAACKYYSGSSCQPGRRPANTPYGDGVMNKAQNIQLTMIDPLDGF